jgi:hypothetical protein
VLSVWNKLNFMKIGARWHFHSFFGSTIVATAER